MDVNASFCKWLAASPLASIVKTFAAVVFAAAVADFTTDSAFDFGQWQTWVIAGLVSVMPTVINWLNPEDARYGRGSAE